MITLSCTNCKTTLNIDEAFAGGVCRCQHCGAIQTVPSRLKNTAGAPAGASKTLYRNKPRAGVGTGLDELAEVVASSGSLTGSGLRSSARTSAPEALEATAARAGLKHPWVWLIGAGVVGVVLVIGGLMLLLGRGGGAARESDGSFAGVPLQGETIVYVIDRGASNQGVFGNVVQAVFQSLASLGPERRFQIIFWNNGEDLAYPAIQPALASTQNILSAQRALSDTAAYGASDVTSAIQKAAGARPDQVILVTAKGDDLDAQFSRTVLEALAGTRAQVLTFSIGEESDVLRELASKTGGSYHVLSPARLRTFGR